LTVAKVPSPMVREQHGQHLQLPWGGGSCLIVFVVGLVGAVVHRGRSGGLGERRVWIALPLAPLEARI
jgi:hypothetical protein